MKSRVLPTLFITALISAGAYYQLLLTSSTADESQSSAPAMPPPAVTLIEVSETELDVTERLPGRTQAYRLAEIRPQVSGLILKRLFEEGEIVEQGQALYQIDPSRYQLDLQRAEANLETARANAGLARLNLQRVTRLRETDAVSEYDLDQMRNTVAQTQAAVQTAQAAVRDAELNLEYAQVYAPISGQISQSLITEGALVTANQAQPLAVITQLDPIYVDVMQTSSDHLRMRDDLASAGSLAVALELPGGKDYNHQGKLQFSSVFVNESTGSVQLRMLFANPDHTLLPGLFVHARLPVSRQQGVLIPQQAAIRANNGELSVWKLLADDTVQPVRVTADREHGNQWVISDGLQTGDRIVLEGFQRLAPGVKVTY